MSMAVAVGVLIVTIYAVPLFCFLVAVIHSRNFRRESSVVRLLGGLTAHASRTRDAMGTIVVPIITPFSITIDREAQFDYTSFLFISIFVILFLISAIGNALCISSSRRLQSYGRTFADPIAKMLENYTRENLIFVAVLVGISYGRSRR